MQKLCGNTIHMVIPLCLNNFFSGAWMNARLVGGFEHPFPQVKKFHIYNLTDVLDQRPPLYVLKN